MSWIRPTYFSLLIIALLVTGCSSDGVADANEGEGWNLGEDSGASDAIGDDADFINPDPDDADLIHPDPDDTDIDDTGPTIDVGVEDADDPTADAGTPTTNPDIYVGTVDPYETGELAVNQTTISGAPVDLLAFVPQGDDLYPVIVFQHGFVLANSYYSELLEHVASHGFVVLAPQMYEAGNFTGNPSTDEEAALATELYDWIATDLEDSLATEVDASLLGLAGHSRGAKVIWRSLKDSPRSVFGVAGVDPVDGTGGPFGGEARVLDESVDITTETLIIGSGYGPNTDGIWDPACAPEGDNHENFFDAASSPAWSVVATNYGHLDMLDDDPDGCGFACNACDAGDSRAPMRQLTGGLLVALFRATLQGDVASLDLLEDSAAAPVDVEMDAK